MKLKFNPNLEYQKEAIQSVVDIFDGQERQNGDDFTIDMSEDGKRLDISDTGWGNNVWIKENKDKVLKNVKEIQKRNGVKKQYRTKKLDGLDFSVEMETGTGKTYVYLRTIHELYQEYGLSKFIVVVPSVAIREGVKKNLKITADHFDDLYDNPTFDWFIYDSGQLGKVRQFATSNSLQVMVTTIQSFDSDRKVMNQYRDTMMGQKPAEFIKNTRPIMILDEPQNMESKNYKQAIKSLNPLCTLRYSATHKKMYNLLYSLGPVDAYNKNLVKTIEVSSVREQKSFEDAYVKVKNIKALKTKVRATLEIEVATDKGLKRKTIKVDTKQRSDLYEFSNERVPYEGYVISEINNAKGYVEFENGKKIFKEESIGEVREQIQRTQIEEAVREHFEKEKRLRDEGVKVLSLFFIDAVKNYRDYDKSDTKGKFAKWFEEIYEEYREKPEYSDLDMHKAEKVHGGYFAKDNEGHIKNTRKGSHREIEEVTDIIMEEKEQLLSEEEPLRFIFSHSALREGWDNPNIFQICTLNETGSSMKKRQEIGRGLRLPVNQEGDRIRDENINILTIIANESYDLFARALQSEMSNAGVEFDKSNIKNRADRKTVKPKKDFEDDEAFKELWERIHQKTLYKVELNTEELINNCSKEIAETVSVDEGFISVEKVSVEVDEDGVETRLKRARQEKIEQADEVRIPNALKYLSERTNLTRNTVFSILKESETLDGMLVNPQQYLDQVLGVIQSVMKKEMVDGIRYEKIGDAVYEMSAFKVHEWETYEDKLWKVSDTDRTLYEYVVYDAETEKDFAKDLETMESVRFYLKLPRWFKISTPLGDYNPDWAVSFNGDEKLYFVAETKSEGKELRPSEKMKIDCGKAHFKEIAEVEFVGPVSKPQELIEN